MGGRRKVALSAAGQRQHVTAGGGGEGVQVMGKGLNLRLCDSSVSGARWAAVVKAACLLWVGGRLIT